MCLRIFFLVLHMRHAGSFSSILGCQFWLLPGEDVGVIHALCVSQPTAHSSAAADLTLSS